MKDPSLKENYATTGNLSDRISLHQLFSTNEIGWHAWVREKLPISAGQSVVELGCGRGDLWQDFSGDFDLLLTDRSPAMLDAAKKNLGTVPRVDFREVDLDAIDLEAGSADFVIANHCLYHAADPVQTLRAIRSVLREEGKAVFATNGRRHMAEIDTLLVEGMGRGLGGVKDKKVVRVDDRFGLETGYEMACDVFEHVEVVRYPDSLHVTDAGPLMDYVRSVPGNYDESTMAWMQSHVEEEIARFGAFFVGKDAGIILVR